MDIRTLIAADTLVWVASSLFLWVVWRSRSTYPGFGVWTAHAALITAGFAVLLLRGIVPEGLSILGGNGLWSAGAVLAVVAIRLFLGLPPALRWWLPLLGLFLTAIAWFTWGAPDLSIRVAIISAFSALTTGAIALHALGEPGRRYRPSASLLGSVMAFYAAVSIYRVVASLTFARPLEVFQADFTQTLYFIATLGLALGGTFGILLLNHQRLEGDLEATRDGLEGALASLRAERAQLRVLEGLLPICSSCRKIRDDAGAWTGLETYIRGHSQAEFTHDICPDCTRRLYPDFQEP